MGRIQGDLKERTLSFALRIVQATDAPPHNTKGWEIGRQLVRSGTSIGANTREADCAFTDADFAHRCNVARREAGETVYWLELCQRATLLPEGVLAPLLQEARELEKILSSIVKGTQQWLASAERKKR